MLYYCQKIDKYQAVKTIGVKLYSNMYSYSQPLSSHFGLFTILF